MKNDELIGVLRHQAKYDGTADYKHEVANRLEELEVKCKRYEDALRDIESWYTRSDELGYRKAKEALEQSDES